MQNRQTGQRGVTATSYGLLVGLIGIVALGAVSTSGSSIDSLFAETADTLGTVVQNTQSTSTTPTPIPDIAGLASCAEINTASPGLPDGMYEIDPDGSGGNAPFMATCDMTTDGGGWTLVHDYTLPSGTQDIDTVAEANAISSVNLSGEPLSFTRIAYRMELDSEYAFAAMDDFTSSTLSQVGMPMDWLYETTVSNLFVESNSALVTNASAANGRIEMWSNCYGQQPDATFNFDDLPTSTDCYGSFQVFNMDQSGQGVMQYNAWSHNSAQDLGLGNHVPGSNTLCPNDPVNPDWTFCYNSGEYSSRALKVYVK